MSKSKNDREAVKVAVRLRPMSSAEIAAKYEKIVEIDRQDAAVYVKNRQGQTVNFKFDFAYPDNITQEEIYEDTAAPIVAGVLEGFNGTVFAYGQTGTGKTYTMDGKKGDERGIMPRAFEHIFDYIEANQDSHQFMITVTYVEIYNDELRDLLASQKASEPLKIREDPNHGIQIRGAAVHKVQKLEDLERLLKFGKKNRKVRATGMNEESSRSHSILSIMIETLTQIEGGQHVRSARLNLVDLAGSERAVKTGATGEGFKEGVHINYELMILGNCIAALTSKTSHIPYRDSKLTMILRDSLGGNARTVMIAALGPASYNFSETMSTLRYAERAKKIENKPKVNMDPKDALLLKYQEELAALQAQLNGTAGPGGVVQSEEDRIAEMEAEFEKQKKKLAEASNLANAEKKTMQKELEAKQKEIQQEKEKKAQFEARLQELGKYLVNGGRDLRKRTEQNEQEIAKIREKLKQREEHAKALEKELEERRQKKQLVVDQCATIQQQVATVDQEFKDSVSQYRNLQLKLPELQTTIQADREEMAQNVEFLNKQIELYTLIIENFVPECEVKLLRQEAVYDDETNRWKKPEADKKALVQKVVSVERPKSAVGAQHPTAGKIQSVHGGAVSANESSLMAQLEPAPVQSRLKHTMLQLKSRNAEDLLITALNDNQEDLVLDIPTMFPK